MEVDLGEHHTIELLAEDVPIRDLVKDKVETADKQGLDESIFIADLGDIITKHKTWNHHLPTVKPFYAVKCNDDHAVLKVLADLGLGFDCASKHEIEKVLSLGVSPDRIIYAHTCKHASMLKYAADNHVSMMTFDNVDELYKIKQIYPTARCVIRIRPSNKVKVDQKLAKKFGCHHQDVAHLLKTAFLLELDVVGVSFHVGYLCQHEEVYAETIRISREVFDTGTKIGFNMKLLDIGGGYPGKKLERRIRFEDIAKSINQSLFDHFRDKNIDVIAEPGEFFVASSFTLATQIVARKIESRDPNETQDFTSRQQIFSYIAMPGSLVMEEDPIYSTAHQGSIKYLGRTIDLPSNQTGTCRPDGKLYHQANHLLSRDVHQANSTPDYLLSRDVHQVNGTPDHLLSRDVHQVNGTPDHLLSRDDVRYMYYLNDGIYGPLRIVTDHEDHGIYPYQLKGDKETNITYESCLWGPTCHSGDVVLESVQLQKHEVGEWLYFPNMGAYTLTVASTFNGMPKPTIFYTCPAAIWYEAFPQAATTDGVKDVTV